MQIIRSLDNLPSDLRGGAISIGNFDGVHLGHAYLIQQLVAHARRLGRPALVFTFDPHPLTFLRPELVPIPMTRADRKAELLGRLGVDVLIAYPTDPALLALSPTEFFKNILCSILDIRAIVEGPNFHFGHNRAGTVDVLRQLGQQAGIDVEIVQPIELAGGIISSSRVRKLIQAGQVEEANRLLTEPYQISGIVGHGAARGRTIGFPTANLEQVATVVPAHGVYAARAAVAGSEQSHLAAVNIGPNPTFGEHATKIEVHLLDYQGDLYGSRLQVTFLARLRDIQPFPNVDALIAQLNRDIDQVRALS